MSKRTFEVDYLARVEGEGKMYVNVEDEKVEEVRLEIFEPPRFYEGFLRGRDFTEAPDITSRICGICPIAYQTSAINAMEDILDITVEEQIRDLRRLFYCGEWIESHGLHIFMLHAPDFLGYQGSLEMAEDHPELVKKALRFKKIGNDIVTLLAGREIHPINAKVGGFYSVPEEDELDQLKEDLQWGIEFAEEMVEWTAGLDFPELERDYEFVAMSHPDEYAIFDGNIISNKGLDIAPEEFFDYIEEEQVPHSTSLHSKIKERGGYFTGPMARFNLNFDQLTPRAKEAARKAGLDGECHNPYRSIIVRTVEMLYAYQEALRVVENYEKPDEPCVELTPQAGIGHGCSEAPRGALYHRYEIDDEGTIKEASIVPPTAQNQTVIEEDLEDFVSAHLHLSDDDLQWKCEQAIRNYDPCISCSCHFLDLNINRD